MRVLHVLHHSLPYLSGYSVRSGYIVNLQRAEGLDTRVVTSSQHPNGEGLRDEIEGTEYRRTAKRSGRQFPFLRERGMMEDLQRQIAIVAKDFVPDIIHAHSPVLVGLPALRVARTRRIPMVYEIRDLWENACIDRGKFSANSFSYRAARALESYVLRRASGVVTICDGLRKELADRVPDARRLHIVANGVDVEAFEPQSPDAELRQRWNLEGKEILLYAGTFQPYEGLDLLVRSIGDVVRRRPHAHLLIVGGSPGFAGGGTVVTPEEQLLQAVVRENSLADHVTFTGRIPHAEVRAMYGLADVLVYPRRWTRTTASTTPLKPLEGMAMGKPVIASDVPALGELVSDGVNGLLFKAGDHHDLAAKCCDLLADRARMERFGQAGREWVIRERQWALLVSKYRPIYEALLGIPARSKSSNQSSAEQPVVCR